MNAPPHFPNSYRQPSGQLSDYWPKRAAAGALRLATLSTNVLILYLFPTHLHVLLLDSLTTIVIEGKLS